jgi:hypothetical protein
MYEMGVLRPRARQVSHNAVLAKVWIADDPLTATLPGTGNLNRVHMVFKLKNHFPAKIARASHELDGARGAEPSPLS